MNRMPAVAGSFYDNDPERLKESIKWSFLHPLGPGKLPSVQNEKNRKRDNLFFIVPHAGYIYSGPVAAHSYYYLASEGSPDIAIIIGPNHTGYGSYVSVWPKGYWDTPLGKVEVDDQLVKELVEYSEVIDIDEKAHMYEHSIEVQIPFLQYFFNSSFKIIPIVVLMQTPEIAAYLAEGIFRLMQKHPDKDIVVLSSSDMNHYDPYDVTYKKDELAIEEIKKLDYKELYEVIEDKDITMCGYAPVMVSMILAKKLQKKPYILKHATSGDTSGDKSSVVGYLAARFGS
ncbi:AmmeMemoRadiSam system protein B [Acidianus manzaensis]|uniref:MEMO1 family protein B6F84_06695 n=1 Tax=Acidianus manzaensis TaxID=282676 RepID=A0A1W6JZT5_9CREN|nr:AmmeMemoRadiSam system protein B [Acidianus manzaensis]ARM75752.1 AmmeMemoRadiSam system protein B [Acidianus manzaensis]